jgi:GNAT superfamily N-acetyltransferase
VNGQFGSKKNVTSALMTVDVPTRRSDEPATADPVVASASMTAGEPPDAAGLQALAAAHHARLAGIDPLLPPTPVPVVAAINQPPPRYGVQAEDMIVVPGAAALARTVAVDPSSLLACWGALTTHRLVMGTVAGSNGSAVSAMDALLAAWHAHVSAQPPVAESSAELTWPSRDAAMTRLFLDRGLAPRTTLAVRMANRSIAGASGPAGVTFQPIEADDVAVATSLQLELIAWDAQFGGVSMRTSTPDRVAEEMTEVVSAPRTKAWVAERGDAGRGDAGRDGAEREGSVVALAVVDWPEDGGWISGQVAGDPARTAYLGSLSVRAGARGAGVGAAFVAYLHAMLDAAGIERTLLHHAALSPLSAPFWARCGYRPLWTSWEVRPHTALR